MDPAAGTSGYPSESVSCLAVSSIHSIAESESKNPPGPLSPIEEASDVTSPPASTICPNTVGRHDVSVVRNQPLLGRVIQLRPPLFDPHALSLPLLAKIAHRIA